MKFAWTTHQHSMALQSLLPFQARPFRLAWTRTPFSSALQGPSAVQANFINNETPTGTGEGGEKEKWARKKRPAREEGRRVEKLKGGRKEAAVSGTYGRPRP